MIVFPNYRKAETAWEEMWELCIYTGPSGKESPRPLAPIYKDYLKYICSGVEPKESNGFLKGLHEDLLAEAFKQDNLTSYSTLASLPRFQGSLSWGSRRNYTTSFFMLIGAAVKSNFYLGGRNIAYVTVKRTMSIIRQWTAQ